jgi:hypothetical protein
MTITLNFPLETEESLLAQAKARGISIDAFLQTIVTNQIAAADAMKPLQNFPREGQDLDRSIDELFDTVQVPPGVGQGATRRENWYR